MENIILTLAPIYEEKYSVKPDEKSLRCKRIIYHMILEQIEVNRNLFTFFKVTQKILFILLLIHLPLLSNPNPISIELKNTYAEGNKITKKDSEQIMQILRKLVIAVEEKNASKIVKYISKEKGAYLDVKGLWDYDSILEEIKKEDSYLEVYFFDHEKLVKQKQSENVLTVRELLQKSGGLEVDLFFESSTTCEGKLKFKRNKKLEKDMNNPYLLKVKGRWYIYRLF